MMVMLSVLAGCDDRPHAGWGECPTALGARPLFCPSPYDAGPPVQCDPLLQTNCNAGEKCSWIIDQDNPPIAHIGCAPDGTIASGQQCSPPVAGPLGFDACVKGSVCHEGTCEAICDHDGGLPACGAMQACVPRAGLFEVGGTTVAGVCQPACDPLTQEMDPTMPACGSTDPTMPDRGCYGYRAFTCMAAGPDVLALTDRTPPRTNTASNPHLNGCAPGYLPFFYEATGSTTTLCSGLCAALPTDSTPAHVGNSKGDQLALGKRPDEPAPLPGRATCAEDQRGSAPSSACRYLWPYALDDQGMLSPGFDGLDLGVCMALAHFQYDSDDDLVPDTPFPDCATLPPRSAATPGPHDDAYDWGCQPYDSQQPMLRPLDLRVAAPPATLVRHVLR